MHCLLRAVRSSLALLFLTLLVAGCDDKPSRSSFISPTFGSPCQNDPCGANGECQDSGSEALLCLCDVGYQGDTCTLCESDFHRDSLDRCVPNRSCAEQSENPCGDGGRCTDQTGVIACLCDAGYEGPRCTLCADRYQRDELGRCLQLFVVQNPAPQPPPTPAPADGGTCQQGYTGAACDQCLPGYHVSSGVCAPDQVCASTSCPQNASCALAAGEVTCTCQPEYSGWDCGQCATGFHSTATGCVIDQTCTADSCPLHATCTATSGVVSCACEAGYQAPTCSACTPGYHMSAGRCVADQTCSPATCSSHASCVVVGGEATCACQPGWGGPQCERCLDLATESTAFEFAAGWPTVPNTCSTRVELAVARLTLRSREGSGTVQLCASSSFNGLTTQHVELQAGPVQTAQLVFWEPVVLTSFDYAAGLSPLSLEVLADNVPVRNIELPRKSKGSLTLQLSPPATKIALRSRTGVLQNVALDNIVYSYEQCK